MTNEEMLGRFERLKKELSAAYAKPHWDASHIDRLARELAALERVLASKAGAQHLKVHPGVVNLQPSEHAAFSPGQR